MFITECDSDYGGSVTIYITNGEFDDGCIAMNTMNGWSTTKMV